MDGFDESKIIQDEEEFLDDVAAYHEQRGYVCLHDLPGCADNVDAAQISSAMQKSQAGLSLYTDCTSSSLREVAMIDCRMSAWLGGPLSNPSVSVISMKAP
jgi:hypothetical protein